MICWRRTDVNLNYRGSQFSVEWLGQIFPRLEYNQQRKTGRQEALGLAMPPSLLLQVIIKFSQWSTLNTNTSHCHCLLCSWFLSDSKTTVIVKLWPVQLWALMSVFSDVSLVVVNTQTQLIITILCHCLINHSYWNKVNSSTYPSVPTCKILIHTV